MYDTKQPTDFDVEIVEEIAVLSSSGNWSKELNVVQWGDNIAKYDIRTWTKNHVKAGKGIAFTLEELRNLKKALNSMDI